MKNIINYIISFFDYLDKSQVSGLYALGACAFTLIATLISKGNCWIALGGTVAVLILGDIGDIRFFIKKGFLNTKDTQKGVLSGLLFSLPNNFYNKFFNASFKLLPRKKFGSFFNDQGTVIF